MPCCGKGRASLKAFPRSHASTEARGRALAPNGARADFEYVGRTSMVIQGPVSGQVYRFAGKGSRVYVDARDAAAVERIANMKPRE